MSIGRVYVQPGAKIAVSDFTVKWVPWSAPFRGDKRLFRSICHGVGEKYLVHSLLEFAGTYALLSFQERGKR